jgi:hypothetical protein
MIKKALGIALVAAALAVFALPAITHADPIYLPSLAVTDLPSLSESGHSSNQFLIGPEAGVFFPTSTKTRDAYGNDWTYITVGFGSAAQASAKGSISPYFDLLYNSHDGNTAYVLPLGIAYKQAFSPSPVSPYYSIAALAVGADQQDNSLGIKYGISVGYGGRAALGVQLGKFAYLEAAYLESSDVRSIDFSGTELEVGARF